jgi:hypothetical protein
MGSIWARVSALWAVQTMNNKKVLADEKKIDFAFTKTWMIFQLSNKPLQLLLKHVDFGSHEVFCVCFRLSPMFSQPHAFSHLLPS